MKIPKRDVLSMYVDCIAQGERTIISLCGQGGSCEVVSCEEGDC